MPIQTPEQMLFVGRVADAIAAAKQQVTARPADAGLRFTFAQMMAVVGRWDEAALAARTAGRLDAARAPMASAVGVLVAAERVRAEVFAGRQLPQLFGEPAPYAGWYAAAHQLSVQGDAARAAALRAEAEAAAPLAPGRVDGRPFDYCLDRDDRLGPMLEVVVGGQYHWMPFAVLRRIDLRPPTSLHATIWAQAVFTLTNAAAVPAFIPVRYAGSEASADPAVQMSWTTTWEQHPDGAYRGLGQRLLRVGSQAVALLDVRTLEFTDEDGPTGGGPAGDAVPTPVGAA